MKAYLDILQYVLDKGTLSDNRTGTKTLHIPTGATFEHNMENGFPLVTTKKMPLKTIATELEFFIYGITDKKWLQDHGCHIWDEWANPTKWNPVYDDLVQVIKEHGYDISSTNTEKLKNYSMDIERDLGPVYGWQWRHFGGKYKFNPKEIDKDPTNNVSNLNRGVDQLVKTIKTLKENPTSRQMVISAWNPADENQMALPPCHVMHQVFVDDGKLNLTWTQRSCDMFLGIPFNIASYALLLLLYAKEAGLKPGILKGEFHDIHIYENHIDQVKTQLQREPKPLPTVEIPNTHWTGMLNWHAENGFILKNYICHEKLTGEVAR